MKIKIISAFVLFILILSAYHVTGSNINKDFGSKKSIIFNEINQMQNKVLLLDKDIGDVHVKYWEHYIDEFYIKGDSILLHLDKYGDIIKYEKNWDEININFLDYNILDLDVENYKEKQLVVFPVENDCTFYYNFYNTLDFPLICWEVSYSDGSIFFYDLQCEEIGYAIPMPSKGFSMSGHNHLPGGSEDPWKKWRTHANTYFEKWCSTNVSISLPTASTVTSYVSDSSYDFFYEIAHGDYSQFRCVKYPSTEIYYHSTGSWNYCAEQDMENRNPMKFAFIGSCGGMDQTGPGSFSDEFRKGQMQNTVTIGYTDMSTPAWYSSYYWQKHMFTKMDEKETIYDAFLSACAQNPIFVDVCKFVGDENLTIQKSLQNFRINNWIFEFVINFFPQTFVKIILTTVNFDLKNM